ncbi:extracellular solute-binding protein [Rubritalea halochordaticola]
MLRLGVILMLLSGVVGLSSCSKEEVAFKGKGFDLDGFMPRYNEYIKQWLAEQKRDDQESISKIEAELANATTEEKKAKLGAELVLKKRELEKIEFRESLGGYFNTKTHADLPEGLVWENGDTVPPIGDPRAKKGGTANYFISSFPATLRRFGPNSNHSFRSELYDNIEMVLVAQHPLTEQFYGIIASEWAMSEDKRTMFYKIRKGATFSNGDQITARDFQTFCYLRLSDNVYDPYYKQYLRESIAGVATYGDDIVAISLPETKPLLPLYASLPPAPSRFYKDYGPDYDKRYQWKVEPTTGAYTAGEDDIVKGRSITLRRVKDWWGNDLPQLKYAYNADAIRYQVIQDTAKAFELFRIGQLDYFGLSQPEFWYDKMDIRPAYDGYIDKATFYNIYPVVPRGFYFNVMEKPVDNVDVRRGFTHAINVQKVINVLFRGDYDQVESFSMGFGKFTNKEIQARRYSISQAREYFAKAGYTKQGEDGILRKPDGTKLSVEVMFPNVAYYPKMMALFQEEARKAGIELVLDGVESTQLFNNGLAKKHKVIFSGWGVTPPFPRYFQFFHSENAVDEEGKPKKNTNNFNAYADPEMDALCLQVRFARTEEELRVAAHRVQQIVHDEALFVPTFYAPFTRVGYWRWMKWPDSKYTRFCTPEVYIPWDSYLWWIDEDVKKETLAAKRTGKTFKETVEVHDHYRGGIPEADKQLRAEPKQQDEKNQ